MEWITKTIEILKIPLKILLPTLCLFSGILLFASDNILKKLNLLNWSKNNGFTLGLIFVVSSCMIIVYVFLFVIKKVRSFWYIKTNEKRIFKNFMELNYAEQAVIIHLYNTPNYTDILDYNQPIIQGLIAQNYIYAGGGQIVSVSILDPSLHMKMTLQPGIYKALKTYTHKLKSKIKKLSKKIEKQKNPNRKLALEGKLQMAQEFYNAIACEKF